MKDPQIIDLIRSGKPGEAIRDLYQHFPKVRSLVCRKGGTPEHAKDVFQEALLIFCRKAKHPDFELTASAGTYLYSVSRYVWKDQLVKLNRQVDWEPSEDDQFEMQPDFEAEAEARGRLRRLEQVLQQLGERCLQVLKSYYYEKLSMQVIAEKLGFSSDKSAKTQKYKCLERARKIAFQQSNA